MHTLGTTQATGESVSISQEDWRQHCYVIGGTGAGKTNLLAELMRQDLASGRGFCLIDKHGDLAQQIADSTRRPVIYWRPADLSHPIGLNLLQNVAPDDRWRATADIVSVFADIWELGEHTPRLLYYLRAAVRLLLDTPNTTLLDIRKILSDDKYRARLLRNARDAETRQTWSEFNMKDDRQQTQEIGSLQNKVAALADPLPLRFVIGQQTSTINIRQIMDKGHVLIVNLAGMGDEPARLLGALLVSAFAQAAEARADMAEEERRDFTLYIDEFQNFASRAFSKILSEARKWRLSLCIAHQFVSQLPEDLQKAVLGNCGTLVSFRIGADDAPIIGKAMGISEEALLDQKRGVAWVRPMIGGVPYRAVTMKTEKVRLKAGRLASAVANTRASYSRPRGAVEENINGRWRQRRHSW